MRRHLRLAAVTFAVSLLAALLSLPASGLTLTGVQSRKAHGAAGNFDLTVDRAAAIGGAITVEPRSGNGAHTIVFQFDTGSESR